MSRAGQLGRRECAGLAAGALAAGTLRSAQAADATTFVSGFGLPVNLDPHQIFDVPMQAMMLNAYDNLYRYQGAGCEFSRVATLCALAMVDAKRSRRKRSCQKNVEDAAAACGTADA